MADNETPKKIDAVELAKRARLLAEQGKADSARADAIKNAGDETTLGKFLKELRTFNRTFKAIRSRYTDIKHKIKNILEIGTNICNESKLFRPIVYLVRGGWGAAKGAWHGYHWAIDKTDHKIYEGKWKKRFAKIGRTAIAGLTLWAGIHAIPNSLGGETVRYFTTDVAEDSLLMATTYKKETVFLHDNYPDPHVNGQQEVNGCTTEHKCDTEDAIFYHARSSLVIMAWNAIHKGNILNPLNYFFIPKHVAGVVIPGQNKCEVTSFGVSRRFTRKLQWYPAMLNANCVWLGPLPEGIQAPFADAAKAAPATSNQPAGAAQRHLAAPKL